MTHIIAIKNGYIITDGISFVQTFLVNAYESRKACLCAAITTAFLHETVWGQHLNRPQYGKIVKKGGTICGRHIGQPHQIEV